MPGELERIIDQIAQSDRKRVRVGIDMEIVDFDCQQDVSDEVLKLTQ